MAKRLLFSERLNDLARDFVRDGNAFDAYFVSDGSDVVTITYDPAIAYTHWEKLSARRPLKECALESRSIGVIASVAPDDDSVSPARMVITDDSRTYPAFRKAGA